MIAHPMHSRPRTCEHCLRGTPRRSALHGKHACELVYAAHVGAATEINARPWLAYVDGDCLHRKSGDGRRFAAPAAAYRAACKAAPDRLGRQAQVTR